MVKPGRMFLRRLINLPTTVSKLDHRVTLNAEARANGGQSPPPPPLEWGRSDTTHTLQFYTDASDKGFGAVYGKRWLFASGENEVIAHANINVRELFAIVAAVMAWGEEWRNKQPIIYTDSLVIACVWRTGTSRENR